MSDDKQTPEESVGEKKNFIPEAPPQKAEENKNPLGEGVKIAMYIIYNEKLNQYGVIGAPGFLDDPSRAYYALKVVEKNLDEFYFKKKTFQDNFMIGVRNFNSKMNFRRFVRFGK